MENPLNTAPQPEAPKPAIVTPAPVEAAPAAAPAPEVASVAPVKKKKSLTTGKIFAIIGGIVVIAVVAGFLIFSQSGERFQGASIAPRVATTTTTKYIPPIRSTCDDLQ